MIISPNYLIRTLESLIGRNYEIDHVNLSPTMMRNTVLLFRKIKAFEIKFFDEYLIIYIKNKPVQIKSYGWIGQHELYFDSQQNCMYHNVIIKLR